MHFALFEEGATQPLVHTTFPDTHVALSHAPHLRWDGTRYVAVWSGSPFGVVASITAQGVFEKTAALKYHYVDGLAVNGTTIVDIEMAKIVQPSDFVIDASFLNADLSLKKRLAIARFRGDFFANYLSLRAVMPFGTGFYIAWGEHDGTATPELVGTRVTAEGTALDTFASSRTPTDVTGRLVTLLPELWYVAFEPFAETLVAIMTQNSQRKPVMGVLIGHDGVASAPRQLAADPGFNVPPGPDSSAPRGVRLFDGTLALLGIVNGNAVVTRLNPHGPRRRAARH